MTPYLTILEQYYQIHYNEGESIANTWLSQKTHLDLFSLLERVLAEHRQTSTNYHRPGRSL